jgi:hypothetical protein
MYACSEHRTNLARKLCRSNGVSLDVNTSYTNSCWGFTTYTIFSLHLFSLSDERGGLRKYAKRETESQFPVEFKPGRSQAKVHCLQWNINYWPRSTSRCRGESSHAARRLGISGEEPAARRVSLRWRIFLRKYHRTHKVPGFQFVYGEQHVSWNRRDVFPVRSS